MQWDGSVNGSLWQRGLSLFYTEQQPASAAQFALDVAGNPNDTEESVWRYLAQARDPAHGGGPGGGAAYARAHMLNTSGETRPYMADVYALYKTCAGGRWAAAPGGAGAACAAETRVLALCSDGAGAGAGAKTGAKAGAKAGAAPSAEAGAKARTPPASAGQPCFYADLYYGLWAEAHGDAAAARAHLHRAGLSPYGVQTGDYMWWLARVHNAVRGWPINTTAAPAPAAVVAAVSYR